MKIGYCRISTREPVELLDSQEKTLMDYGCECFCKDVASGFKA